MTFLGIQEIQERYNLKLFQQFLLNERVMYSIRLTRVYRQLLWTWCSDHEKLAGCVECTHGISSRAKHGTVCQLNVLIWPLIWLQVWRCTPNASMVERLLMFSPLFSAGVCVGAESARGRRAKENVTNSDCTVRYAGGKNAETVRTTWLPSASESDFCANIAQNCHCHAVHVLSTGLNSYHQAINVFWQNIP